MTFTSFEKLLQTLINGEVEFILIGGLAGIYHGAARMTQDIDIVYSRSDENIKKVASCLSSLNPYLRDAPEGLPFSFDYNTIKSGLNFTLTTSLGSLDLLGEASGNGTYDKLLPFSEDITIEELNFKCVNLDKLIELKRAAGRAKDLEAIAELEIIRSLK